jgi:3-methylfumaryl-CoA hydratase
MPDLDLPRLLLAGRMLLFRRDLMIGEQVERASIVRSLDVRGDATRRRAVVTIGHEIGPLSDRSADTAAEPAIVETQTYVLLPEGPRADPPAGPPDSRAADGDASLTVVPDATLLFHYSALGFNSHRIHLDRDHARTEGYPDLVVNGGLIGLLMTEWARRDLGVRVAALRIGHKAPLFAGRPVTFTARRTDGGALLSAHDDGGLLAAEAEVTVA